MHGCSARLNGDASIVMVRGDLFGIHVTYRIAEAIECAVGRPPDCKAERRK